MHLLWKVIKTNYLHFYLKESIVSTRTKLKKYNYYKFTEREKNNDNRISALNKEEK